MTVDPDRMPPPEKRRYHDEEYLFCSEGCARKFEAKPEFYLESGPNTHASMPTMHISGYICPMCPEVWSEIPAPCPVCGMALEAANPLAADEENPELADMTQRFWVAALFTAPVFAIAMSDHIPGLNLITVGEWNQWFQAALTTPVVMWAGLPFFERGRRSIWPWRPNMFTLIALGTGTAYLFSLFALLVPEWFPEGFRDRDGAVAVYFEAAAVIISLVLLGQMLELRARGKTGAALRLLLDLAPKTANRVEEGHDDQLVSLGEIRPGDLLRVRPGENVPTDGEIAVGQSTIDESMVTGESLSVTRTVGEPVFGGTTNGAGSFVMRVTSVGQETLLARIAKMVSEAQRSRAPIQRVADKVAAYFVPAVIAAAVIAFAAWSLFGPEPAFAYGIVAAVSVLIIACPCALGLATPMSIMVGMGRGASEGVLIRNAEVLERLCAADTVVLDKTGTITKGSPTVVAVMPVAPDDDQKLLRLAAALEVGSEHPLAQAIIQAAKERGLQLPELEEFVSHTGRGVGGKLGERRLLLGNAALMTSEEIDTDVISDMARQEQAKGATVVYLAEDGALIGGISISDPVKPSAPDTLQALRRQGVRIIMLTGDQPATANAVASSLPIDEVVAGVSPTEKLAFVDDLRAKGHVVAMAGDGINDAPALAKADVGIAMGSGTDIAIESADVVLVGGTLDALLRARNLSSATMKNIHQNLFFAFIYNALGVPIAAGLLFPFVGILLSPMVAAAAMSLSSVSVIANALRLRISRL